MIAAAEPAVTHAIRPVEAARPPMPREHGAWGVLLIPFTIAAAVSGVFDLKVALLLVSILCFYVARASYLKHSTKWVAILLAASALCTVPLLVVWRLWWLIAFAALAAPLAFRKTERSTVAQLIAVCGLTLTAPAAWYAATGRIDPKALSLWLLNALYFGGGVFYVKMHVAAAMRKRPFESVRVKIAMGASTLFYHTGALVCLIVLAAEKTIPPVALVSYAPVAARAITGVARLSPTLRIKRLGWTEVAHSVVFAITLIALLRWSHWSG